MTDTGSSKSEWIPKTTIVSSEIRQRHRRRHFYDEKNVVVYFNPSLDQDNELQIFERELRFTSCNFLKFNRTDQCFGYAKTLKDGERAFLIVNDHILSFLEMLSSALCTEHRIESIYIFSSKLGQTDIHYLRGKYLKLAIVCNDIKIICDRLKQNLKKYEYEFLGFQLMQIRSVLDEASLAGTKSRNRQHVSFMYTQLFKEIVTQMAYSDADRREMLDYCRFQYENDPHVIELIDELERDYILYSPVWWYTRPGFLYKMLNRALYQQDIDTLYAMRVFVKDLHQQLVQLHSSNTCHTTQILTLYRGARLPRAGFEILKNSQGSLYSINNFLSTSIDREVALVFAGDHSDHDLNQTPVLFEIHVDLSSTFSTVPFANIDRLSYFEGVEREYLFSIGSVFRIHTIQPLTDIGDVWSVHLTLTSENDSDLANFTEHMRKQIGMSNSLSALGRLIFHMGDYEKSKQVYLAALMSEMNTRKSAALHNNLGMSHKKLGNWDTALSMYHYALDIEQKYLPNDDPYLAVTLSNISTVHFQQGHFDLALPYAERSLAINLGLDPINHENLAISYDCMGSIFYGQGKVLESLDNYQHALAIRKTGLPANHPHTAVSYNNIGFIYSKHGRHEEALSKIRSCLEMELISLPTDHPSIADTYSNIGCVLFDTQRNQEALEHCQLAVRISLENFGNEHFQTKRHQAKLDIVLKRIGCEAPAPLANQEYS